MLLQIHTLPIATIIFNLWHTEFYGSDASTTTLMLLWFPDFLSQPNFLLNYRITELLNHHNKVIKEQSLNFY